MKKETGKQCSACENGKLIVTGDQVRCNTCSFRNIEDTGKKIVLDGAFKSGDELQ